MTRGERANLGKGLAFLSPWLIGFCVFTAGPSLLSLYYSFCDYSLLQKPMFIGTTNFLGHAPALHNLEPAGPPKFTGLSNYRGLMGDAVFWRSILNTFYYAIIAIPSSLIVSLSLALLLTLKIRGQGFYRTIIFLPSLVQVVASSMLWLWLLNAKLGLINVLLGKLGIAGPGWLTDEMFVVGSGPHAQHFFWVLPALALINLWTVGQTVTIFVAGIQDIPLELYEAAEIDGAGIVRQVFNVTVPTLSPVIFFNLIMAIIGTLQVFTIPYITTEGGPSRASYFLTMYLYDNAFRFLKMGYASSMALIQLLLILLLTVLAFWSSKRWVHYGGK